MLILFTDETNRTPDSAAAKFFAYGGLVLDVAALPALDASIAGIRKDTGYRPGDALKFDTRARPLHVTKQAATEAKRRVIQACLDVNAKFIVCVVLHAIARNTAVEVLVRWGANDVIGKFNYYLTRSGDYGIVAVDRLPNASEYGYLTEKFCKGLSLPDEATVVLDRIKLFTSTCLNASHASSAMDIVLGSFRYCINAPQNLAAAQGMMANVTRLIWCEREGHQIFPFELGVMFRPKTVRVPEYQAEYDQLLAHINSLLKGAPDA